MLLVLEIFILFGTVEIVLGDCCSFQAFGTGDSGKVDLSEIGNVIFNSPVPNEPQHTFSFGVCRNLNTTMCGSEGDPTPAIDFNLDDGSCLWVGSLENCQIGGWNDLSKSFVITYPGKPTKEEPLQSRSMEITVHCDYKETDGAGYLASAQSLSPEEMLFEIDLYSAYGCPGYKHSPNHNFSPSEDSSSDFNFFWNVVGFGGILLLFILLLIGLYFLLGVILFIFKKIFFPDQYLPLKEIVLGWDIHFFFWTLVFHGVLLFFDLFKFLFCCLDTRNIIIKSSSESSHNEKNDNDVDDVDDNFPSLEIINSNNNNSINNTLRWLFSSGGGGGGKMTSTEETSILLSNFDENKRQEV